MRRRLHLSDQQRRFLARALLLALGIRIGLLLAGYLTGYIIIGRENTSVQDVIYETFNRWDATNYQRIAEVGYQAEGHDRLFIVFFPLYPLAIRIVHFFGPGYFVSALLVSSLASVAAGFFIQALISADGGDDAESDRGVWYMSLFPTAYFLAMPYTESLFLALALGSFVAARNGRWLWSGGLGMLACATRMQGLALVPALALEAFLQDRWRAPIRAFWLVFVPVGFLLYLGINWSVLGGPFEFVEIQREHWSHDSILPWDLLFDTVNAVQNNPPGPLRAEVFELALASILLTAGLLAIGAAAGWLRPSYQVYGWASLIFMTSATWPISLPRYLLGVFPLFLVLARLGRTPGVHQTLLTTSALLMGALYVIYATRWGF